MKIFKNFVRRTLYEILTEDAVKVDVKKYLLTRKPADLSIWDIIKSRDIETIKLEIKYYDEIDHEREFDVDCKTIAELKEAVSLTRKDFADTDLRYVKSIHLYVWYNYKGKRELESHNFMDWKNNHYDLTVIDKVFGEIRTWIEKHPEFLL